MIAKYLSESIAIKTVDVGADNVIAEIEKKYRGTDTKEVRGRIMSYPPNVKELKMVLGKDWLAVGGILTPMEDSYLAMFSIFSYRSAANKWCDEGVGMNHINYHGKNGLSRLTKLFNSYMKMFSVCRSSEEALKIMHHRFFQGKDDDFHFYR